MNTDSKHAEKVDSKLISVQGSYEKKTKNLHTYESISAMVLSPVKFEKTFKSDV
jgi:hypothetical protein